MEGNGGTDHRDSMGVSPGHAHKTHHERRLADRLETHSDQDGHGQQNSDAMVSQGHIHGFMGARHAVCLDKEHGI